MKKIPSINLDEYPASRLIIFKRQGKLNIDSLSHDQWQLLTLLDENSKLQRCCEILEHTDRTHLLSELPACLENGWIATVQ